MPIRMLSHIQPSRWILAPTIGAALTLTLAGCGGASFSPTIDTVSGVYTAATFAVTTTAGTTNLLTAGATASVTLAPDGTTTGRLFVPGGAAGGGDLDEDLTGTWTLAGTKVTFNQAADTFIRDVEFTAARNRLSSQGPFGGATIHLVLAKTG